MIMRKSEINSPDRMRIKIKIVHYFRTTMGHEAGKYLVYQTIIYGQFIPCSHPERADFVLTVMKGKKRPVFTVGKELYQDYVSGTLKAEIMREVRKRISVMQKSMRSRKTVPKKDWDEFLI